MSSTGKYQSGAARAGVWYQPRAASAGLWLSHRVIDDYLPKAASAGVWLSAPKTLDRRLCTGRSGKAVVIFLFGLGALLTRDSRVLSCVVSSSPKL